jgi:single-strand DNA-binding protein
MNKSVLTGRFTKDPTVKYTQDQMCVARFTLAVNRKGKDKGADFINCVAFGKQAEFINSYMKKGMKADLSGRITTGSYKDKDGKTVYTTEVTVEDIEFGESKNAQTETKPEQNDWQNVPDDLDSELPFN